MKNRLELVRRQADEYLETTMNGHSKRRLDIRDIASVIRRRKWLIILPWVLVVGLSWGGSHMLTPKYESAAIVSIDPSIKMSGEMQKHLGSEREFRTSGQVAASMLQGLHNEITSSRIVAQVNEQLNLTDDPKITQAAVAGSLRQQRAGVTITPDQIALTILQDELKQAVKLTFAGEDQLRISAISTNQVQARDIANTLADVFIREKSTGDTGITVLTQSVPSGKSQTPIVADSKLQKYEKDLSDAIGRKTELEKQFQAAQSATPALLAEANRNDLQTELKRIAGDISDYQKGEKEASDSLAASGKISLEVLALKETEELSGLKSELKREVESYGKLLQTFPWSAGQMVNVRLKQNSVMRNLEVATRQTVEEQFAEQDENTRMELSALFVSRANIDYYKQLKQQVESVSKQLTIKSKSITEHQANLKQLERDIASATEARDKYKLQATVTRGTPARAQLPETSTGTFTGTYRKVEPAQLALAPFSPNRVQILMMIIILGLVLGIIATVIVELFDSSFKRVEDVQEYLGIPVIGVIPRMEILRKVAD